MSIQGARLREEIDRIGVSNLARLMEKSRGTIYNWAEKENVPLDQLVEMAKHGVNVRYVLENLLGDEPASPSPHVHNVEHNEVLVMVPRYNVRASAGHGVWNTAESVVDRLAFRREWISLMGLNPKRLAMIHVEGDSMEPTLFDNDIILINLDVTELKEDGVYVIQHRDVLRVKRIQNKMTGEVVIRGDNHAYESETLMPADAERLHVVGRVVWFGREL